MVESVVEDGAGDEIVVATVMLVVWRGGERTDAEERIRANDDVDDDLGIGSDAGGDVTGGVGDGL